MQEFPLATEQTPSAVPENFEALKALIVARYPRFSRQLQAIARFVLDHPNDTALDKVATLAGRVHVQPSALVRFAQALGYDGFSAMQAVFRSRLVLHFDSLRDRLETLGTLHAHPQGESGAILADVIGDAVASLQRLGATVPTEALDQAASILAAADHVYVLAQGKPYPIGFYLYFALLRLRRRCTLLAGPGGVIRQELDFAGQSDALMAISFRPYTPQVIDMAREHQERGLPVIAITDGPLSPLWSSATVAFEVVETDSQIYQSLIAPMCMAQVLAMNLGHHLLAAERGRR